MCTLLFFPDFIANGGFSSVFSGHNFLPKKADEHQILQESDQNSYLAVFSWLYRKWQVFICFFSGKTQNQRPLNFKFSPKKADEHRILKEFEQNSYLAVFSWLYRKWRV